MKKKIEMNVRKNRGWKSTGILALVIMILIVSGSLGAAMAGYLPIALKTIAPPNSTELSIDEVKEDLPDYVNTLLENMPHQKDILIKVYLSTNLTSPQILSFYSGQLANDKFECIGVGMLYLDKKTGYISKGYHHGSNSFLEYYGYQKGLTVVAVIICYDCDNQMDCTTFFVAGNVWDFRDVATWLQTL